MGYRANLRIKVDSEKEMHIISDAFYELKERISNYPGMSCKVDLSFGEKSGELKVSNIDDIGKLQEAITDTNLRLTTDPRLKDNYLRIDTEK